MHYIEKTLIPKVSSTVGKRWKLVREMGGSNYGKRGKAEQKGHKKVQKQEKEHGE